MKAFIKYFPENELGTALRVRLTYRKGSGSELINPY